MQLQLVMTQGVAQLIGEGQPVLLVPGHRLGKEDIVALTGPLGHVGCGVGLLHQNQMIGLVAGEEADPHRGAAVQLVITDVERGAKQPHQLAGEVLRQNFGGDFPLPKLGKEQGKLVPEMRACTRLSWGSSLKRCTTACSS